MASQYAANLKGKVEYGPCGMPEIHETNRAVAAKLQLLARMIQQSRYVVVHTGAGISTSCGIPDFRGPNGIWTLQKSQQAAARAASKAAKAAGAAENSYIKQSPISFHSSSKGGTRAMKIAEINQKKRKRGVTSSQAGSTRRGTLEMDESDTKYDTKEAVSDIEPHLPQSKRARVVAPPPEVEDDDEDDAGDIVKEEKFEIKTQDGSAPTSSPLLEVSWDEARPSLTHMALMAMVKKSLIQYIVTQNVDGLHVRSGIAPSKISELHGNVFKEKCDKCYTSVYNDKDLKSLGLKRTGRKCTRSGCDGDLRDTMVDWDQSLPDDELDRAEEHSEEADLAICIGTSLRVSPANELPQWVKRKGGKLVIINLQRTELDGLADLTIRAKCDTVFEMLMPLLKSKIPEYGKHAPMKFVLPEKWIPYAQRKRSNSSSSDSSSSDNEDESDEKQTHTPTNKRKKAPQPKAKFKATASKVNAKDKKSRSLLTQSNGSFQSSIYAPKFKPTTSTSRAKPLPPMLLLSRALDRASNGGGRTRPIRDAKLAAFTKVIGRQNRDK